jgi:hypothetical protein
MIPDANWISALKLPTKVMLGLLIASVALLVLDSKSVINLAEFGALAKPGLVILAVASAALSITGIGAFFVEQWIAGKKHSLMASRREIRDQERREARQQGEAVALARIDHLSPKELRYLADCLKEGSQSFYTYVHSPPVTTLMGKGLVYTPGGTHHQDHYPYTIADFAWKVILERKEEILEKDAENRKREEAEDAKRRRRY